jgi:hypothetical protein
MAFCSSGSLFCDRSTVELVSRLESSDKWIAPSTPSTYPSSIYTIGLCFGSVIIIEHFIESSYATVDTGSDSWIGTATDSPRLHTKSP